MGRRSPALQEGPLDGVVQFPEPLSWMSWTRTIFFLSFLCLAAKAQDLVANTGQADAWQDGHK